MKFKDYLLEFAPLFLNGTLVTSILIGIIATGRILDLIPFALIIVPVYISECVVTFRYFKGRK